jgi:hypothetical protein
MLQVNPKVGKGISSKHPTRGAFIALADGNVVFLTEDACSPPQLAALLSIRGGEEAVIPYRDPR